MVPVSTCSQQNKRSNALLCVTALGIPRALWLCPRSLFAGRCLAACPRSRVGCRKLAAPRPMRPNPSREPYEHPLSPWQAGCFITAAILLSGFNQFK